MSIFVLLVVVFTSLSQLANWTRISIALGFSFALLLLFILSKFFKNLALIGIILISLGFFAILYWDLYDMIHHHHRGPLLLNGYSVAIATLLIQINLPNIKSKVSFTISALVIRLAILASFFDHHNISQIVLSIVVDFASLYFQLQKEVETRQNFKVFYDYTQARTQFEHVMKKHLPQSLAIFNLEINDILFYNRSFSKSFPYDNLTFTALDILASFMVSHDPFTAGSINFKKMSKTNLLDYLKKINKHDVLTEETISTFAIFQDKLYEVKIFQVTWDRAPAVALIMNDISEYEDSISLKVANVSKDKVIATISHELRTPLNAILGILQILKKGISDQTYLNYISLCKNNCILLLSMIQSFLDLHSARKNKLRFKVHQVEVRMLLHDVLNTFEYMCVNPLWIEYLNIDILKISTFGLYFWKKEMILWK